MSTIKEMSPLQLCEQLKLLAHPVQSGAHDKAPRLVKRYVNLCHTQPPGQHELSRCNADVAIALTRLIGTTIDPKTLFVYLTALLNIGPAGWAGAVRFVHSQSIGTDVLRHVVTRLRGREQLLLLDGLVAACPEQGSQVALCKELLTSIGMQVEDAEALQFFRMLGESGRVCTVPLAQTLLAGSFGPLIRRMVGGLQDERHVATLCDVVRGLGDERLTTELAAGVVALASAGHGPDSKALEGMLRVVGECGRCDDDTLAKALSPLAAHKDTAIRVRLVDALIDMNWSRTPRLMATMCRSDATLRKQLCLRPLWMDEAGVGAFLETFAEKEQRFLYVFLFLFLARNAPDFLLALLTSQGPTQADPTQADPTGDQTDDQTGNEFGNEMGEGMGDDLRRAFIRFINDQKRHARILMAPAPSRMKAVGTALSGSKEEGGFLSGLFGRQQGVREHLGQAREVVDKDFDEAELSGVKVQGRTFRHVRMVRASFDSVRFEKCRFTQVDLSLLAGHKVVFKECSFTDVVLRGADLKECAFIDCTWSHVEAAGASFTATRLQGLQAEGCMLAGLFLNNCRVWSSQFAFCDLASLRLFKTVLRSSLLEDSTVTDMQVLSSAVNGVQWLRCDVRRAIFHMSRAFSIDILASSTCDLRAVGMDTDCPELLDATRTTLREAVCEMAREGGSPKPPAALVDEAGMKGIRRCVHGWVTQESMRRREARMLEDSRRRVQYARHVLGADKADFLRLMPYLVACPGFEAWAGLEGVPALVVSEYVPDYSTLQAARKLLGTEHAEAACPREGVRVEALYTIGSLGTLAQSDASDADVWLCYDETTLNHAEGLDQAAALDGMRRKLEAIAAMADERFGVECYFFPMSLKAVRANDFGVSEDESSGSAQAILLKEEFYRTALRIGGKSLAWWLVPVGGVGVEFEAAIARTRDYPVGQSSRSVDLGFMPDIPPGEFFGASIWQFVKAMKSPFKSLMKLGLLEKYALGQGSSTTLLCDRLKANVLLRRREAFERDAYTLLFKLLSEHYQAKGDDTGGELIREAFITKAKLHKKRCPLGVPEVDDEASLFMFMSGSAFCADAVRSSPPEKWSFARALDMGGKVNTFMTTTYQEIVDGFEQATASGAGASHAAGDEPVNISQEDLTRLGRKIVATFASKPGKVELIPFVDVQAGMFSHFHFSAIKKIGKRPVWVLAGKQADGRSASSNLTELRRSTDVVALLAWMVANHVYHAGMHIEADATISPLSVDEIVRLLKQMSEFFPTAETFERPPEEALQDERVRRALMVVNLPVKRDREKILSVTVVYATTWGEMFCTTLEEDAPDISKGVSGYMKSHLSVPVTGDVLYSVFTPPKARCKRVPEV